MESQFPENNPYRYDMMIHHYGGSENIELKRILENQILQNNQV